MSIDSVFAAFTLLSAPEKQIRTPRGLGMVRSGLSLDFVVTVEG